MFQIEFDGIIFKEAQTFVAYCPKLDVSSCGNYEKTNLNHWMTPRVVATELMSIEA